MFLMLQVGAVILAVAYLLLMRWPEARGWAHNISVRSWSVAFSGSLVFATGFLGAGVGSRSVPLLFSGCVMIAAAVLAGDGRQAAQSYQRMWAPC